MATSPKAPVPCPICKDVGILAFGIDVQYCMCPTGRKKQEGWYELPLDMRDEEEAISRTLPDLETLRGAA